MAIIQCPYCAEPYTDANLCLKHMSICSKKSKPESTPESTQELKQTNPLPLGKMKVDELKELASDRKIEGYENMKKDELINALKEKGD